MKAINPRGFKNIYIGLLINFIIDCAESIVSFSGGTSVLPSDARNGSNIFNALSLILSCVRFVSLVIVVNGLIESAGDNKYLKRTRLWLSISLTVSALSVCVKGLFSLTDFFPDSNLYIILTILTIVIALTHLISLYLANRDILQGYTEVWNSFGDVTAAKKIRRTRITMDITLLFAAVLFVYTAAHLIIVQFKLIDDLPPVSGYIFLFILIIFIMYYIIKIRIVMISHSTAKMISDISK